MTDNMDKIKNNLRLKILQLNDNVLEMTRMNVSQTADLCETGDTVENQEIKVWGKDFTKGFECPVCHVHESKAVIVQSTRFNSKGDGLVETGDSIFSGINADNPSHMIDENTKYSKGSFETKEEFDEHMKVVHGIVVDDTLETLTDEEAMKRYGPHYHDFRYKHEIRDFRNTEVKVKPRHHPYKLNEEYYQDKTIQTNKINSNTDFDEEDD